MEGRLFVISGPSGVGKGTVVKELLENKVPNYHGIDVGVSTLMILKYNKELTRHTKKEEKN